MVTQAKLQYYRHNYCLVCMTGVLGCRWHRYKQSTRDSRKRDLLWFTLFVITFLFIIFYFYFWLIAKNSFDDLNWQMFKLIKSWVPWYKIMLGLTCAAFGYMFIVMFLYLCHAYHGHQLYIHPIHIVLIIATLLCCVAMCIALDNQWATQFYVLYLSLKVTGPFLQIGTVILLTSLTWLIAGQWYKIRNLAIKWSLLLFFIIIMVGLYITPLYIKSPCVISIEELPPKPKLLSHRGASRIAPENTLIAFQKANESGVYGYESDVVISFDGVPYLMHDSTLRRTTNIKDVFPDRIDDDVSMFNISDVKKLNAGGWFLETDPMWSVSSLTEEDKIIYKNQSIPTLEEFIQLAVETNKIVIFDLRLPPIYHPYFNQSINITIDAIQRAGLKLQNLWWLEDTTLESRKGVKLTAEMYEPLQYLHDNNITNVNVQYDEITADQIREYKEDNITTNVWLINSKWFLSYYWCIGAESITTNNCDILSQMESPVWQLEPSNYLILWVSIDVLSVIIITTIFIVHRVRLYGTSFSPETISLNAAKNAYKSRTMKEQLLGRDVNHDPSDDVERNGVLNRPAAYSMASLPGDSSYRPYSEHVATRPDAKYELE
ncbi:hypothetical protein LOTGIDRAFT_225182 [Lottia gigantea]|uniref:GP-PDE domain-containing protein n=1 Tax=Lottia gigantea TaxID=225164 RepID=V4AW72_LOTGI|nr:hypothetical protein LOTGIDRAFT_225182 [Lottia gigantea]ESP01708.1 hypothetical protein LOTGIDRAFT_225182 [Lottia gigantea]